mgnify:CR=1 FL=1
MAKISAKKSNLKTIANKIIVSPSTAAVSDLKFKRRKDFSTFGKWIESSSKALAGIKLPSKKEIQKLGGSGGGFPWLLALLGLGGLGALAASKMGDGDDGIDGIQKALLQDEIRTGTNFSGQLPTKFKVPKKNKFKIKKVKTGGPTKKTKIKSSTLKKVNKGTKPGKVKIDKGKITSSKNITKAPSIPKKIEVTTQKILKKNPLKNVKLNKGVTGFLRGTATKVGGVLAVADVAHTTVDRLQEGQSVDQAVTGAVAEGAGSWYGFGAGFKLGSFVTGKAALPLAIPNPPLYLLATIAGGAAGGFLGSHIGRKTFGSLADKFTGALEKVQAKEKKKTVAEKKKEKNSITADTTVPVPVITSGGNNGTTIPVPIGDVGSNNTSSSSAAVPFSAGVNNDNPFTDLLLTNLK